VRSLLASHVHVHAGWFMTPWCFWMRSFVSGVSNGSRAWVACSELDLAAWWFGHLIIDMQFLLVQNVSFTMCGCSIMLSTTTWRVPSAVDICCSYGHEVNEMLLQVVRYARLLLVLSRFFQITPEQNLRCYFCHMDIFLIQVSCFVG
jgi:hypothetical protein